MSTVSSILSALSFHDVRVIEVESVTQTSVKASAKGITHDVPLFDADGNPAGVRTVRFDGNTTHHNLRTVATVRGMVGVCYSWLVNIARVKAGKPFDADGRVESFTALPTWGEPVLSPAGERFPYVRHDDGPMGPFYLPMHPTGVLAMRYMIGGDTIPDSVVAPHRRSSGPSRRQGLDGSEGIVWRKYAVRNIARVKVGSTIADGPARTLALALMGLREVGPDAVAPITPAEAGVMVRAIAEDFAPRAGEGVDG